MSGKSKIAQGMVHRKSFDPKKITGRYLRILQMHMLGWKNKDIALEIGCSPQTVSDCLNSPIVRKQMDLMKGSVLSETMSIKKRIDDLVPQAVKVYEQLLKGKMDDGQKVGPSTMESAAKTVLQSKVEEFNPKRRVEVAHAHFTKDDLVEIQDLAERKMMENARVVEAEVEEIVDED